MNSSITVTGLRCVAKFRDLHEPARSYICEGVGTVREICFTRQLTSAATVDGPDARSQGSEADQARLKLCPNLVSAPLPELVQCTRAIMPNGDRAKVRPDASKHTGRMLA